MMFFCILVLIFTSSNDVVQKCVWFKIYSLPLLSCVGTCTCTIFLPFSHNRTWQSIACSMCWTQLSIYRFDLRVFHLTSRLSDLYYHNERSEMQKCRLVARATTNQFCVILSLEQHNEKCQNDVHNLSFLSSLNKYETSIILFCSKVKNPKKE
jgi:hypothetical protein